MIGRPFLSGTGSTRSASSWADLVLTGAQIATADPTAPWADAMAVREGTVTAVGRQADILELTGPRTTVIDAAGRTVLPGLVDPHVHLLSWAASRTSLSCGPPAVVDISGIGKLIRTASAERPTGTWIRGAGYDESALEDGRPMTKLDLDHAAPRHPVRIQHRSGLGWLINSRAEERLRAVGIRPPEAPAGSPSLGLVTGADAAFRDLDPPNEVELVRSLADVGRDLLAAGITLVQDATPQDLGTAEDLERLTSAAGGFPVVKSMISQDALEADPLARPADPVKVLLDSAADELGPQIQRLRRTLALAGRAGRGVAIHAPDEVTVAIAVDGLRRVRRRSLGRARLEHLSICPPPFVDELRDLGLIVVTHPGFLYSAGDRYLRTIPGHEHGWLYRVASLRAAGIEVAAASDGPVGSVYGLPSIRSAMTRRTRDGAVIGASEKVGFAAALRMHTRAGAIASASPDHGVLRPGSRADFILLDGRFGSGIPRVVQTFVAGRAMLPAAAS